MAMLGTICLLVGGLIGLFYGIMILILAFKKSILWGLGSLFVPLVSLIFVIMYWDEAKDPFLKSLIAIPFYIVGILLTPSA